MFDNLTQREKDDLRRTLEWVMVATQSTTETRKTLLKVIEMLSIETPIGIDEIHDIQ